MNGNGLMTPAKTIEGRAGGCRADGADAVNGRSRVQINRPKGRRSIPRKPRPQAFTIALEIVVARRHQSAFHFLKSARLPLRHPATTPNCPMRPDGAHRHPACVHTQITNQTREVKTP